MNSNLMQSGYSFNEKDIKQIQGVLDRVQATTGVTVSAETGNSAGFAAVILGINDLALSLKAKLIMVQSSRNELGNLEFGVLAVEDLQPVNSNPMHDSFIEGLIGAEMFLRRFIEELKLKRSNDLAFGDGGNCAFEGNVIVSAVLSEEEVLYVQVFANDLGRLSGLRGFAKFTESKDGFIAIALGVLIKDAPMLLGTAVVVSNGTGRSCSVRDFQNNPMPGLESYRSIQAALVATKPLFEKLALLAAKHSKPSLLKRFFGFST